MVRQWPLLAFALLHPEGMPSLAHAQMAGPLSRSRTPAVRRDPAGAGRRGIATTFVTRILLVVGLALIAWQGWSHFTAETPAPTRTTVSADALAGVQIILGQAALALRDFGTGGLLSDRFEFEQHMARVHRSLDVFEGAASAADERHALGRVKSLLERLIQIEKDHVARVEAGRSAISSQTLAEIPDLRDAAARALVDFREAGVRPNPVAKPDSLTQLLHGSIAFGVALLSLCIGAVSLWSRLFST